MDGLSNSGSISNKVFAGNPKRAGSISQHWLKVRLTLPALLKERYFLKKSIGSLRRCREKSSLLFAGQQAAVLLINAAKDDLENRNILSDSELIYRCNFKAKEKADGT